MLQPGYNGWAYGKKTKMDKRKIKKEHGRHERMKKEKGRVTCITKI